MACLDSSVNQRVDGIAPRAEELCGIHYLLQQIYACVRAYVCVFLEPVVGKSHPDLKTYLL